MNFQLSVVTLNRSARQQAASGVDSELNSPGVIMSPTIGPVSGERAVAGSEQIDATFASRKNADRSPIAVAQANLRLMGVLLNIEDGSDSFSELLQTSRDVFAYDQAMVLEASDRDLKCVASVPGELIGRCWTAVAFQNVLSGQILSGNGSNEARDIQLALSDLVSATQPVICLPIGVRGRAGVLVMARAQGEASFGDGAVAVARQCAVVSLAALAARNSSKHEAEFMQLKEQVTQLQQGEESAQKCNRLLQEITNQLPIGVTVQDDGGRFILVNTMAAANLATPADVLIGASPADFLPDDEAAQRRQWEIDLIQSGKSVNTEENIKDKTGERTWLTSHRPVRVLDETVLLSSSLDITERKQFEHELARHAHFDELTGLPNGILVQKRVELTLQRTEGLSRVALAFIDIDNFKHINDYYSRAVGDALLVEIAQRIKKRLRDNDVLGRIGGNEFLLFINPVKSDDQLHILIDHILWDLKQPFHIDAFEIFTSASIGVGVYPEHGANYEAARRSADRAMYRAKHASRGEAVYFDANMGLAVTARMEIEQRLRLAIRDRRFCCAFQPKVDIQTQDIVGFESLVRWRDDDGEIHPPGDFIGLAIELGLIDPITTFVLAETLASIERLDEAFGSETTISINVAAKQAGDMHFMRPFMDSLKASPYADRIMLELTEDAFAAKGLFQTKVLPVLREIGVRVSIDDFGTGYSSLSALADITADEVKVDRSFISDIHKRPRNQSVLRAIESLANALGMSIIAEGVESFEELAYLQAATRIRYAQGFYFSKPLYLDEVTSTRSGDANGRIAEAAREQPEGRGARVYRRSAESRSRRG